MARSAGDRPIRFQQHQRRLHHSLGTRPDLQEVERAEEAVTACQDAIAVLRETGNRRGKGTVRAISASPYRRLGGRKRPSPRAKLQDRHLPGGLRTGAGRAGQQGNLADALLEAGRMEEAITSYRDAVAIFRETGDRHGEGRAVGNLGIALRRAGQAEEAVASFSGARSLSPGDRKPGR